MPDKTAGCLCVRTCLPDRQAQTGSWKQLWMEIIMLKLTPDQVPSKRAYKPAIDLLRQVKESAKSNGKILAIAVQRENGYVCRYDLPLPVRNECAPEVIYLSERIVKFLLWSCGGWRIMLSGPQKICQAIKKSYSPRGSRKFDYTFMSNVYGRKMVVERLPLNEIPQTHERSLMMDRRTGGGRLGFKLSEADFKVCAVRNGRERFSAELSWDPLTHKDPDYHYNRLNDALKMAASHLRRVDAIGGSTAGVVVDNRVKVSSLFRAVDDSRYAVAQDMFVRLSDEWGVPVEVANDGDVTALAGLISLGKKGILGVDFGCSEAGGYVDTRGCLTGRLNELAFAPVDFYPSAAIDEWSGDAGVGAMYFSQQAVNRLAVKKGMRFPAKMLLTDRLCRMQERLLEGDPAALHVFQKIGLYLGYTVPWYREFYDFNHLMALGPVTAGLGGIIIVETARLILHDQFPEMAEEIDVFIPDNRTRKTGQATVAASLPML
ncbi:MAG: ROK family protein [Kiritimatiellia bacterium]